jgi:Leucine-rich repeat (LRR) protein
VLYDVVMLYIWNQYTETKNLAEKVLEKFLPADLFGHLRGRVKLYYDDPSEDNISNYLQSLQHTKLNPNLLGIAFYEWTQCGRRFCVQFPDSFLVVAKKELRNNVLHLTQTQLKKLAETIGELSQLKMLYLQNNHLKDLPTAFVKLQRLNTLNLSKNNFSNFPPEVFALPCLQHLSLSHNKVTDIPAAITRLPRLTTLNLQHNAISILPEVLAQLTSLKVLELKNNPLKMKKAEIQAWLPDCKIVM